MNYDTQNDKNRKNWLNFSYESEERITMFKTNYYFAQK